MQKGISSKGKLVYIDPSKYRKIIVVGDIHGDLESLSKALRYWDANKDLIIFLGDYADRGKFGVEVIEKVIEIKKKHPCNVVALKGNHESYNEDGTCNFYPCDLKREVEIKRGDWNKYFKRILWPFFSELPVATIIPNSYLFVHGGISSKIKSLKDLENPTKDIEEDILWSDPFEGFGEYSNPRGAGVLFGVDITEKVTKILGVKRIVRSHEPYKIKDGKPYLNHKGRVVTIATTGIRVYGAKPIILILDPKNLDDYKYVRL